MHDYISTLIAWRRDILADMLAHIERRQPDRGWLKAVAARRRFSECTIYGRYADEIDRQDRHFHDSRQLCAIRWSDRMADTGEIGAMIDGLAGHQVAIGIQSFLGIEAKDIRAAIEARA